MLQIADDFIDNVVTAACQIAKHRKSNTLEVKDVQLHLGKTMQNIRNINPVCRLQINLHKATANIQVFVWAPVVFWPLSYFSFQPVLHDWCNKGHGMCYPVSGMVHIKEPLLLINKSSLCGGRGFPFSLSEWSLIHMSDAI